MKNQEQANNNNHPNDPTVANDPQAQVEFDDLPMPGEQEDRVIGGSGVNYRHPDLYLNIWIDADGQPKASGGR